MIVKLILAMLTSVIVITTVSSAVAEEAKLDAGEVMAKYAEIIQTVVSPQLPPDTFISILPIGLPVDDDSKYWPLADSCLTPQLFPGDLTSLIRVSDVYSHALENMARVKAPSQPTDQEVEEARNFVRDNLATYEKYRIKFNFRLQDKENASSQAERDIIESDLRAIRNEWIALGFKREVEAAQFTIRSSPSGFVGFHQEALEAAIKAAGGPGSSPRVTLSVSRDNWDQRGGWSTVKFDDKRTVTTEITSIKRKRGSGGFGFGSFRIGGSAGSTKIEESIDTDVRALSIELDLQLVNIDRAWLNRAVFFEPKTWGWRSFEGASGNPPLVSSGLTDGLFADAMNAQEYAGTRIDCQLIPSAFLLAKRRKLSAVVSKTSYDTLVSESGGGGSFSFYGFGVGGSSSNKFEKVTDDGSRVEFSITSLDWKDQPEGEIHVEDVIILGTISRVVPLGPTPQSNLAYDGDVWIAQ